MGSHDEVGANKTLNEAYSGDQNKGKGSCGSEKQQSDH